MLPRARLACLPHPREPCRCPSLGPGLPREWPSPGAHSKRPHVVGLSASRPQLELAQEGGRKGSHQSLSRSRSLLEGR